MFSTHRYLPKVAGGEAVHIARTALLREGRTLSEATRVQCRALGIAATILPVTDAEVGTLVDTGTGRMPLLGYIYGRR